MDYQAVKSRRLAAFFNFQQPRNDIGHLCKFICKIGVLDEAARQCLLSIAAKRGLGQPPVYAAAVLLFAVYVRNDNAAAEIDSIGAA